MPGNLVASHGMFGASTKCAARSGGFSSLMSLCTSLRAGAVMAISLFVSLPFCFSLDEAQAYGLAAPIARATAKASRRRLARWRPAFGGSVVGRLGVDPGLAARLLDLLPEWRAGLQIIHQELGGGEGGLAVARRGRHQHNRLPRRDPAEAVNDGDAKQRPARDGFIDMARDFRLGHARIMFERERADRFAVFIGAADAGEGH